MSDWERFCQAVRDRRWGNVAIAITANAVAVAAIGVMGMIVLLAGLHALDWFGALPCGG